MDYLLFEKILTRRAWSFALVCFLILILSIFGLVYVIKNMRNEKFLSWILIILSVSIMLGTSILGANIVSSSVSDIKNSSYITYNGVFVVSEDVETPSKTYGVYIPNKDGLHLEASDTKILYQGEYFGKITYGKKSKIIFEIQGEKTGDDSVS